MIEIEGLTKDFGTLHVLRDIDLSVAEGECYGLLGPNGAGKTTLINLICGLLRPTSGSLRVAGQEPTRRSPNLTVNLGLAPQELALFSGLTGRENLEFLARIHGIGRESAREEADALLSMVGLIPDARRRTGVYSQGMKQRLNIAAALVGAPRLVLLDEPTSGLDPLARIGVWRLIEQMKRDGRTILMATHNLEEADRLCDRVAILSAGVVKAVGSPLTLTEAHAAATFEECFLAILEEDE